MLVGGPRTAKKADPEWFEQGSPVGIVAIETRIGRDQAAILPPPSRHRTRLGILLDANFAVTQTRATFR